MAVGAVTEVRQAGSVPSEGCLFSELSFSISTTKIIGLLSTLLPVCHGAIDPWVPAEEAAGFQMEMYDVGADRRLIASNDAVHALTQPMAGEDPSKGATYQRKADERSWQHMKFFYDEVCRCTSPCVRGNRAFLAG